MATTLIGMETAGLCFSTFSRGSSNLRICLKEEVATGDVTTDSESLSNLEGHNNRRSSLSTVAGGIPQLGRPNAVAQSSDRRAGSSMSGYGRDEYNWRYDNEEHSEDVMRASAALENLQLERNARRGTTSWRLAGDEISEEDSTG